MGCRETEKRAAAEKFVSELHWHAMLGFEHFGCRLRLGPVCYSLIPREKVGCSDAQPRMAGIVLGLVVFPVEVVPLMVGVGLGFVGSLLKSPSSIHHRFPRLVSLEAIDRACHALLHEDSAASRGLPSSYPACFSNCLSEALQEALRGCDSVIIASGASRFSRITDFLLPQRIFGYGD